MSNKNWGMGKYLDVSRLAKLGRGGDTMLAHINPQEAALLKSIGGSGTINPNTGLPEFAMFDDTSWGFSEADGGGGDFGGGYDSGVSVDNGGGWYDPGPVDTGPVDTGPVSPVDTTPVYTPVDTTPVDTTPVDTTPAPVSPDVVSGSAPDMGPYEPGPIDNTGFGDYLSTYDPYADDTPSTPTEGVPLTSDDSNTPEITITDTRPTTDTDTTGLDMGPTIPVPPYEPDVPEITITDTRPPSDPIDTTGLDMGPTIPVPPVEDDVPEITITDDRPVSDPIDTTGLDTGPVIPVPPIEDDVPEITITDDRPVVDPVPPDIIDPLPPVPPDIWEPPVVDPEPPVIVDPEPPVIPPVVTPPPPPPPKPPVVTPPPKPPVVTPPPPPPGPPGKGLNPGLIKPTEFYKTYSPVQSKFNWGQHGYQTGPTFDAKAYNQAPGSATPWGLQQMFSPMTAQDYAKVIAGGQMTRPQTPNATRNEAYNPASMVTPNANNTYQLPTISKPSSATATTTPINTSNNAQYQAVTDKLGANWFNKQQAAAQAGDWVTYNEMQKQIDAILNPVIQQY